MEAFFRVSRDLQSRLMGSDLGGGERGERLMTERMCNSILILADFIPGGIPWFVIIFQYIMAKPDKNKY